jgi:hypothetical protein
MTEEEVQSFPQQRLAGVLFQPMSYRFETSHVTRDTARRLTLAAVALLHGVISRSGISTSRIAAFRDAQMSP